MKAVAISLLLVGLSVSAQAVTRGDLDKRLRLLAAKFEEMQAKPDKRIPADTLRRAVGIVLLQSARGGFIFGYEGGRGVAMVKDPKSGQWSAPAFVSTSEGTFGAQIGGQTSFTVILLMNRNTVGSLMDGGFSFGGEATGTAGNASSVEEGDVSPAEPLSLVYNDASGLYGGAVLKGGNLTPDSAADVAYYGQYVTAKEILLDHNVTATGAATYLADKLNQFSR